MGKKLFVGNLAYSINKDTLEQMFAVYGSVLSVQVIKVRDIGRSKRFGFVEMGNEHEAHKAICDLNGQQAGGRILTVSEAKLREDGGSRGGYGGGYVGGRSSRY